MPYHAITITVTPDHEPEYVEGSFAERLVDEFHRDVERRAVELRSALGIWDGWDVEVAE